MKSQQAINKMKDVEDKSFFSGDDLWKYIKSQLLNQPKNVEEKLYSELIELTMKIGLVKKLERDFTIEEKYRNKSLSPYLVTKLWIDFKLQEYILKKSEQGSLDKYFNPEKNGIIADACKPIN
jgi:hypothetical protein